MQTVNHLVPLSPVVPGTCSTHARPRWVGAAVSVALGALVLILPACNTTEGAGKDVQAVGRGIENAADAAKP